MLPLLLRSPTASEAAPALIANMSARVGARAGAEYRCSNSIRLQDTRRLGTSAAAAIRTPYEYRSARVRRVGRLGVSCTAGQRLLHAGTAVMLPVANGVG